jgi:hypothetical protein
LTAADSLTLTLAFEPPILALNAPVENPEELSERNGAEFFPRIAEDSVEVVDQGSGSVGPSIGGEAENPPCHAAPPRRAALSSFSGYSPSANRPGTERDSERCAEFGALA